MKVKTVSFKKQVGRGYTYTNDTAEVTVEVEDGDDPLCVFKRAEDLTKKALGLYIQKFPSSDEYQRALSTVRDYEDRCKKSY